MLLEGKVCIVSGIGPGLGRQLALACAREGADVVLGARTLSTLESVAGECEALGARTAVSPTDICDAEQCSRLVKTAVGTFGRLDVLVNSAFRPPEFTMFESADLAAWKSVTDTNVFGTLQLTQAALPALKESRGAVVIVNSMIQRKPLPMQGSYAISKGGLLTAAKVLALELAPYGIRVNSVVPGWMWGPPVQTYVKMMSTQQGISEEDAYQSIAAGIPLGEIPPDADVAEVAVFLASERARSMTGQTVDVNGGEVLH
jgi:NAD(P)-dependent dehydrogenase (short-subunit alcohol dehydrogenase family)